MVCWKCHEKRKSHKGKEKEPGGGVERRRVLELELDELDSLDWHSIDGKEVWLQLVTMRVRCISGVWDGASLVVNRERMR